MTSSGRQLERYLENRKHREEAGALRERADTEIRTMTASEIQAKMAELRAEQGKHGYVLTEEQRYREVLIRQLASLYNRLAGR